MVDPIRGLSYEIFHRVLSESDFKNVKKALIAEKMVLSSDFDHLSAGDRTGVLDVIFRRSSGGAENRKTLQTFKKIFASIDRPDLVIRCKKLEETIYDDNLLKSIINGFKYFLFDHRVGLLILSVVFGIAAIVLNFDKLWVSYRYYKCTWDGDTKSLMSFTFTTYDMIDADVEGNIEFEWKALVNKLKLDISPHPMPSRYFLNTNRCILGEIRVQHSLDNIKAVRGAEIFAVSLDCKNVFYHSNRNWVRYKSARKIYCTKNFVSKKKWMVNELNLDEVPTKDDH